MFMVENEDIYMNLEVFLIEEIGLVVGKFYIVWSRND